MTAEEDEEEEEGEGENKKLVPTEFPNGGSPHNDETEMLNTVRNEVNEMNVKVESRFLPFRDVAQALDVKGTEVATKHGGLDAPAWEEKGCKDACESLPDKPGCGSAQNNSVSDGSNSDQRSLEEEPTKKEADNASSGKCLDRWNSPYNT